MEIVSGYVACCKAIQSDASVSSFCGDFSKIIKYDRSGNFACFVSVSFLWNALWRQQTQKERNATKNCHSNGSCIQRQTTRPVQKRCSTLIYWFLFASVSIRFGSVIPATLRHWFGTMHTSWANNGEYCFYLFSSFFFFLSFSCRLKYVPIPIS